MMAWIKRMLRPKIGEMNRLQTQLREERRLKRLAKSEYIDSIFQGVVDEVKGRAR